MYHLEYSAVCDKSFHGLTLEDKFPKKTVAELLNLFKLINTIGTLCQPKMIYCLYTLL